MYYHVVFSNVIIVACANVILFFGSAHVANVDDDSVPPIVDYAESCSSSSERDRHPLHEESSLRISLCTATYSGAGETSVKLAW